MGNKAGPVRQRPNAGDPCKLLFLILEHLAVDPWMHEVVE